MPTKPALRRQPLKRYQGGKPGTKYWRLAVWYDLAKHAWGEPDKAIAAALGHPDGAGTGLGQRDMDWAFSDEGSARVALSRVQKIIGRKRGFHTALDAFTEE
jgi:hypothetical protein